MSGIWATPDLIPKQFTGGNYTNLMHISGIINIILYYFVILIII